MALYQLAIVALNEMHTQWLGEELGPGTLAVITFVMQPLPMLKMGCLKTLSHDTCIFLELK